MWSCCSPRVGTAGLALLWICPGITERESWLSSPSPSRTECSELGAQPPSLLAGDVDVVGPPGCLQLCLSGSGNGCGTFSSCSSLLAIPHPSHSPVLPNGSAARRANYSWRKRQLNKTQWKLKIRGEKKKISGSLGKAAGEHVEQISPARGEV